MNDKGQRVPIAEYQEKAMSYVGNHGSRRETLAFAGLGLTGEAGEVADYLKKVLMHGHPFDRSRLLDELGDVLWYITYLAELHGASLDDLCTLNLEKLRARYPNGYHPHTDGQSR